MSRRSNRLIRTSGSACTTAADPRFRSCCEDYRPRVPDQPAAAALCGAACQGCAECTDCCRRLVQWGKPARHLVAFFLVVFIWPFTARRFQGRQLTARSLSRCSCTAVSVARGTRPLPASQGVSMYRLLRLPRRRFPLPSGPYIDCECIRETFPLAFASFARRGR